MDRTWNDCLGEKKTQTMLNLKLDGEILHEK